MRYPSETKPTVATMWIAEPSHAQLIGSVRVWGRVALCHSHVGCTWHVTGTRKIELDRDFALRYDQSTVGGWFIDDLRWLLAEIRRQGNLWRWFPAQKWNEKTVTVVSI